MSGIESIDKNFAVHSAGNDGIVWFDCLEKPFTVNGVSHNGDFFERMPQSIADTVNNGVASQNCSTAGGRVRFMTDSPVISIRAEMKSIGKMPHFALSGSAGFDLYSRNNGKSDYIGTFMPPFGIIDGYSSAVKLPSREMRELTINFPLYSGVTRLYIGLESGSELMRAPEYAIKGRIVYYGSSITQGGCASRPGNCYQSIISRELDSDYINLGFSGNALGETVMARYIASLDMNAFVLDYDHNAPTAEHLKSTHEPFFRCVRDKHPDLPIIMLSRPKQNLTAEELCRRDIIRATYENAVANGDGNVRFIDGGKIFGLFGGDSGSVDNCHPNDLGFMCMAQSILPILKEMI